MPIGLTPAPLTGEIRANTYVTGAQINSSVTALAGGGYLVSWSSSAQDGSANGIYAQRYDAAGAAVGGEFRVNSYTADDQAYGQTAALADGGFVVTWSSLGQDGSGYGVYAQRYDVSGAAVGEEFRVNTYTANRQIYSTVTTLSDGGFLMTWSSAAQDGSDFGVFAQRYDASGLRSGGEFRVNSYTASNQTFSAATALSDGGFLVTWQSLGQDGSGFGIFAQRYDAAGAKAGSEYRVNTTTSGDQTYASVAALADGGHVVTWQSLGQDGSGSGIFAQLYNAAGAAVGGEFKVNTATTDDQSFASVSALANGGFVVSWSSLGQDGSGWGTYAQWFDPSGAAMGGEFRINQTTSGRQSQDFVPRQGVTQLADGSLVLSWSGNGVGDNNGVFVRQFSAPAYAPPNVAPLGADTAIELQQDTSYTFTASTFPFSDANAGDTLATVRIDTLALDADSSLKLNGVDVIAGQEIAAADLAKLVFIPGAGETGVNYSSLTFSVADNSGAYDPAPNTLTFNVAFTNPDPVYTNGGKLADTIIAAPNSVDYISGNKGNDYIDGGNLDDVLFGNNDNDTLYGGTGNDLLYGGQQDDILFGGDGNDRVAGEQGTDTLNGGSGADIFAFGKSFGIDTVTDFEDGIDKIEFSKKVFANLAAVTSHMTQDGADVLITSTAGDVARIQNVLVSQLTVADFIFVA